MKKRIIVITDCKDVAANELRATLIANLEKLDADQRVEVEPFVEAKEFSIVNGAFLVRLMAEIYNPQTTTFLVVLNPLETNRPDRARIIGQTRNGFKFVGENTGTLNWLIKDFGIKEIYESSRKGLQGKKFISFGGKYVHAPIAAKVASGIELKKLGKKFDRNRFTHLDLKPGTVVHIDNFGVIKIFGQLKELEEGNKVKIFIKNKLKCLAVFTKSMKNLPDDTWALYPGSSLNSLPEIGKVRSLNAAKKLDVQIGDVIRWELQK